MDTDTIQVWSTIVLGAAAIFGPVLAELIQRRILAPRLKLTYEQRVPFYHKTWWRSDVDPEISEPAHYFKFRLENNGRSQARRCEVVLEGLWLYDVADRPTRHVDFSPQNLGIGSTGLIDINPERRVDVTIGRISSLAHQLREERGPAVVDVPGTHNRDDLRFIFSLTNYPYSQPSCLVRGRYGVKFAVYSENAPRVERYYRIDWSGEWRDSEAEMLRSFVLTPISSLPS